MQSVFLCNRRVVDCSHTVGFFAFRRNLRFNLEIPYQSHGWQDSQRSLKLNMMTPVIFRLICEGGSYNDRESEG